MTQEAIILTGGAGYIGSHIAVVLAEAGYDIILIDDFSNASKAVVPRIEELMGNPLTLIEQDLSAVGAASKIADIVGDRPVQAIIHLAGLKAVGESVRQPERYFRTNLGATLGVLDLMEKIDCDRLVFSSSATVYSAENSLPVNEEGIVGPVNPYGQTKLFSEQMIASSIAAHEGRQAVNLRYFNPVGAHPSGDLGEDPNDIPNNLFPLIAQVAAGARDVLNVFGNDYPTVDGTGVRDYVHVMDLARGHLAAVAFLQQNQEAALATFNLGTGTGYSVLEVIDAFAQTSGKGIPVKFVGRRDGDLAEMVADPSLAGDRLGWRASKNLAQMCADYWRFHHRHPDGHSSD